MNLAIFLARSPKMTASSSKPSTSVTYDLLYYISSEQAFRKPVGKDLREGEITLPLIFTLPEIEEPERNRLKALFKKLQSRLQRLRHIDSPCEAQGALDQIRNKARSYVGRAAGCLSMFPGSPAKTNLLELNQFKLEKKY